MGKVQWQAKDASAYRVRPIVPPWLMSTGLYDVAVHMWLLLVTICVSFLTCKLLFAPAVALSMGVLAGATMVMMPAPTVTLSVYELAALLLLVHKQPRRGARPQGNRNPTSVSFPTWYMTHCGIIDNTVCQLHHQLTSSTSVRDLYKMRHCCMTARIIVRRMMAK